MTQESPSERACDRCRDRRVKCDKRRPACVRCEKLGKPCPGYDKKRKFVDEGIALRKKFTALDHDAQESEPTLNIGGTLCSAASSSNFPASATISPLTFLPSGQVTAHQPAARPRLFQSQNDTKIASSVDIDVLPLSPYPPPPPLTVPPLSHLPPSSTIDTDLLYEHLWNPPAFDAEWFDLDPDSFYSKSINSCGFIPNAPNIVDEVDREDILQSTEANATPISSGVTFSDSNLWAPESQFITSALITDEREVEMAYLIRHFTESLGPWMDLFDRNQHFSHLVPLKALRDALLRNAIAAVAAKHLGRVKGRRPFMGDQCQKPSVMETLDDVEGADWFYKAANYYDKAINFSRQYLHAVSGTINSPSTSDIQASISVANSDDLLIAVSIFSLYESLDNLDLGWTQHLVGLQSLLSVLKPTQQSRTPMTLAPSVSRLASFWNFARADYQAAYIQRKRTLLDTDDYSLWNSFGIEAKPKGSLYHSTTAIKYSTLNTRILTEIVAHTLLWLTLRVMNYLALETDQTPTERRANWNILTRQFDEWHSHLPDLFQPCAQVRHIPLSTRPAAPCRSSAGIMSPGSTATSLPKPLLTESFYSIDICAASLQLYHFARILLLLHQPPSTERSGAWGSRLKAYREVSSEAIKHAHEIISIALGRPRPAIRVEMLLPLFVAGSCLEAEEERRIVLELLQAIEMDTGCSTEARCQELVKEWGWNQEPIGVA